MAATIYRFRFHGVDDGTLDRSLPVGTAITVVSAEPRSWVDVSLNPGPFGSAAQLDLYSVMSELGWEPVAVNPTTPLSGVTTREQLFSELGADITINVVAPFAPILSIPINTDADTLLITASVSAFTNIQTYFRLTVDGVQVGGGGTVNGWGSMTLTKQIAVAAGLHNVALEWRLSAAGTARIRPVTQSQRESATLLVDEQVVL